MQPIISVIIPTRNRPPLVKRAVQTALTQTIKEVEVIVVIDGPDESTCVVLTEIDDPRLRVIELPIDQRASAARNRATTARNTGISEAKGEWVALLDDDDEWFPQKLELQLEAANRSRHAYPIVICRLIAHSPKGKFIWPRKLLIPSEPLSEYLLARNSLFQGEGLIQTCMLFTKKDLLQKVPFRETRCHEWDWVLRVSALTDVGIECVPEPLLIWYIEEGRKSLSSENDWQHSLSWIQEIQQLVTPRAYSAFIMTFVSSLAAREGDWKAFWFLLKEATQAGSPKPIDFLLYTGMWLIPQNARRQLRAFLHKERKK